ncbi:pentapeptide repeat-containing protein [Streptomyces californicus]|uniref:pentapeptide repeat-containing protein n=1 Tax=Streptomyces californicus TaxID=67351 RepID=UPI00296ED14A|nr:pentapeptide repeat-containing protein [Streptomyces californicus]MDW4901367.1 pentapeptide repeat-containing protein [Streptomyces californicus]
MASSSPQLPPSPPSWPHCGIGTGQDDPIGCVGIRIGVYSACLAHLADADRQAYLADLGPGSMVDHRGTTFTGPLLEALLSAVRDPATGYACLGAAQFQAATFQGMADFPLANFQGDANFHFASFHGYASFQEATFHQRANFHSATFHHVVIFDSTNFEHVAAFHGANFRGIANFHSASFFKPSSFQEATFQHDATFQSATFHLLGSFRSATFLGSADFSSATFLSTAQLVGTIFERAETLGPLVCAGDVQLSGAQFRVPVTLMLAARSVVCRRTQWSSTAELRLRYATVDFSHAVFEYPLTIASEADRWVLPNGTVVVEEALASTPDASVMILSLRGVDAAHLVLADINLSACLFTGTVHLDQVRLEGACQFAGTPTGTHWRRWRPVRFSQRRTVVEESHWRVSQPLAVEGWDTPWPGVGQVGPVQLTPVYRALRKAFEDGKNEPGAADFYYGEMEMRRHDRNDTTPAERKLLQAYWALSGYGLRAGRALGWLTAAMITTVAVMMLWGLPTDDPKPVTHGRQSGQDIRLITDTPAPVNPTGPLCERVTTERFEKSLRVVINSVVFRSSGQDLTTAGTYTEMTSRIAEPVLLGLAILAIRNRVKR